MSWIFKQSTGELSLLFPSTTPEGDNEIGLMPVGIGYAGLGLDKDDPTKQNVVGQGPLPQGMYTIGGPIEGSHLGPLAMPLIPDETNEMFGRSGFFIHGDSLQHPGQASHGCIVLSNAIREKIATSQDNRLEVIA